jgi:hypothetical protein
MIIAQRLAIDMMTHKAVPCISGFIPTLFKVLNDNPESIKNSVRPKPDLAIVTLLISYSRGDQGD